MQAPSNTSSVSLSCEKQSSFSTFPLLGWDRGGAWWVSIFSYFISVSLPILAIWPIFYEIFKSGNPAGFNDESGRIPETFKTHYPAGLSGRRLNPVHPYCQLL